MTPSKEGKRVDIDETIKQLKAQLEENDFNNYFYSNLHLKIQFVLQTMM